MWEDRTDSTHLVNLVPTVISAEPCKAFFDKADWYIDNTRPMEIKPDGVKVNGFEIFKYSWEKDGNTLAAGFERTGRRFRLLETNDYRIEMMAESHELAFGLDYGCTFEVENKSGKPLHIKIQGKQDGNVSLDCAVDTRAEGKLSHEARFTVGEITEPQDIWRVHPCAMAEVTINGKSVVFGLGIETRWPVNTELSELKKVALPGTEYIAYFNFTSALRTDAEVTIQLPENPAEVTRFELPDNKINIPALGRTSLKAQATAVSYGHEALRISYEIRLPDNRIISYTRPLHVESRGLTGACGYEMETDYILQNGLWKMGLNKNGAHAWTHHVYDVSGTPGFSIGQLGIPGGPYNDEFTRMKPARTAMYRKNEDMVLEAAYESKHVAGIEYTSIYTLNATGIFTRRNRIKNIAAEEITCTLKDEIWPGLSHRTVLPYNGGIHTIAGGLETEAGNVDIDKIDENWVFEADPKYPNGICWPAGYTLNVRWGNGFFFEHEAALAPGEAFETEPVIIAHGLFPDYISFRDFARQTYTTKINKTIPHIEWEINNGNPFAAGDTWTAGLHYHRNARLEGEILVTAGDEKFAENENRRFTLEKPLVSDDRTTVIHADMRLNNFHKSDKKAIFTPCPGKAVTTVDTDGLLTADNGVITFKVDPRFSDACFSFVKDGKEWLMSRYPSKEPYAWYNPFIGGLNTDLQDMREAITLREPITAAFARETDNRGNVWQGISSTVTIREFDKHKGLSYTQYYLTLPGLPVLCYFARLNNNSGVYKKIDMEWGVYFGEVEDIKSLTLSAEVGGDFKYRFPAGVDSWWRDIDRLAMVEIRGREDKLYLYRDTAGAKPFMLDVDTNTAGVYTSWPVECANGGSHTGKPIFMMATPQTLTADMLVDLDGVEFP
jgi:hypothetical protein